MKEAKISRKLYASADECWQAAMAYANDAHRLLALGNTSSDEEEILTSLYNAIGAMGERRGVLNAHYDLLENP